MPTNDNLDPVNRWATEHYGFHDDPPAAGAPVPSSPGTADPPAGTGRRPRRRRTLLAAAVLSLASIAGLGGVAAATVGDDVGQGGRQGGGRDGVPVRFDDGGGRTGLADGGRR